MHANSTIGHRLSQLTSGSDALVNQKEFRRNVPEQKFISLQYIVVRYVCVQIQVEL